MGDDISECTLCGKTLSKMFLIEVEGSQIEVCEKCSNYGKIIREVKSSPKKVQPPKEVKAEPERVLKPNFGMLIIQARRNLGLERKDFAMKISERESVIKRVESQQMRPDDKLIKKIESFLKIEITEIYEDKEVQKKTEKGTLTIGDIIEVKE